MVTCALRIKSENLFKYTSFFRNRLQSDIPRVLPLITQKMKHLRAGILNE
jgi:hypothetical protein